MDSCCFASKAYSVVNNLSSGFWGEKVKGSVEKSRDLSCHLWKSSRGENLNKRGRVAGIFSVLTSESDIDKEAMVSFYVVLVDF